MTSWQQKYKELTGRSIKLPKIQKEKVDTRYIYVFRNPIFGYFRIGVASNVKQRLSQVNRACGCNMEFVWCTNVRIKNYEEKLEAIKADLRGGLGGDWYDCDWYDIDAALTKNNIG